ncbi:MAG: CDP-glycerol glycerophosphotransferase family protein [Bacillales bacterium]|jgi:CDP-glycerol glycerophosphotransferase (TagB/SpsB family)|nr:CDP-glycerol glycerophosphotransferase family protein [Bacillales bacterium]
MVKELFIYLYLLIFKTAFSFFNMLPLKEKVTFVVSFGDNSKYVFEEIRKQKHNIQVIFLCKKSTINLFKDYNDIKLVPLETSKVFTPFWFMSIYHLATSRYILIDNYFGFLAGVDFKKGVECIQLWHATGALKKFGLEDETIRSRHIKAKERFLKVYSKFNKVVVGSDIMADTFARSFNLNKSQILATGIPRTDFFFNENEVNLARKKLASQFNCNNKKVILYTPTYRDEELDKFKLKLDVGKMSDKLGNEFILLLRLHPAIQKLVSINQFSEFIIDVSSNEYDINELLIMADYLITDYSSVSFEFSLLKKPIIFYTYDLDEYKSTRGVLDDFENNLPGPIVRDTESIIELIQEGYFDLEGISRYSEKWNQYSKGQSSYNLVKYMFPNKKII